MTDQDKLNDFRKELISYDIHNSIVRLKTCTQKMWNSFPNDRDVMTPDIARIGEAIEILKKVEMNLFDAEKIISQYVDFKKTTLLERC